MDRRGGGGVDLWFEACERGNVVLIQNFDNLETRSVNYFNLIVLILFEPVSTCLESPRGPYWAAVMIENEIKQLFCKDNFT